MFEPYVAVKQSCILGESPIWCAAEQALLGRYPRPMIYRWDPVSVRQNWRIQTEIGSIGFAGPGRFIAGTRMGSPTYPLRMPNLKNWRTRKAMVG